jgi:SpoVK/Ycf46/Vps4 family AAA+-type ATPase
MAKLLRKEKTRMPHLFFHGKPGTGKTHFATELAKNISSGFITPDIRTKQYVGSEMIIRESVLKESKMILEREKRRCLNEGGVETIRPVVIILDEIDSMCPPRTKNVFGFSSSSDDNIVKETNNLLKFIDDINGIGNIMIIGITNSRRRVDDAILRIGRIDNEFEFKYFQKNNSEENFENIYRKFILDIREIEETKSKMPDDKEFLKKLSEKISLTIELCERRKLKNIHGRDIELTSATFIKTLEGFCSSLIFEKKDSCLFELCSKENYCQDCKLKIFVSHFVKNIKVEERIITDLL